MKYLLRIVGFFVIAGLGGVVALAVLAYSLLPDLPDAEAIKDVQLQVPLRVYANGGELLAEFGEQRREPVDIEDVPEALVHAVLAAEDDAFYSHPGVDFVGVMRAAYRNIVSGQHEQGASTITMQVARNYFLTREKTYTRKLKEALLAFRIEQSLSKDQILELYLNKIFLGHRAYGFAAASRIYYGKKLNELEVSQLAVLAGLPKAPSRDNPVTNPERAKARRDYVLSRMHKLGYLDDAAYAAAVEAPIVARRHHVDTDVNAPYVAEMVRDHLLEKYGEEVYWRGYKVYTTIVPRLQHKANNAIRKGLLDYSKRHGYRGPVAQVELTDGGDTKVLDGYLKEYPVSGNASPGVVVAVGNNSASVYHKQRSVVEIPWDGLSWAGSFVSANQRGPDPATAGEILAPGDIVYVSREEDVWRLTQLPQVQGALVSLNPNNGAILALTGGFDFFLGKYNRITQAERQPGSNIKPFIYSAALERQFTPATLVSGAPIVVDDATQDAIWRPENYSGKFFGPTRLRKALSLSLNLVSVRILRAVGLDYARDYLARFGFDPKSLPNGLSLALGSGTVHPIEVVRGYAVLANGGYLIDPYFIDWIEDERGRVIEEAKPKLVCDHCNFGGSVSAEHAALRAPRVISPENHYLINSMMRDIIRQGTGRRALSLGRGDLAGKTGTTNDFRDAWFSGFARDVVTTVWVGFDDSRTLGRREAGSRAALPIWVDYMEEGLQGVPERKLPMPDNIVAVRVSSEDGSALAVGSEGGFTEYFKIGTEPELPTSLSAIPGSEPTGGGAQADTEGLF